MSDVPSRFNYDLIHRAIEDWISEKGSCGKTLLIASPEPPYYPLATLPKELIEEVEGKIQEALAGNTEDFPKSKEFFHLFALSGVAQFARRSCDIWNQAENSLATQDFHYSFCPVCGERQLISTLIPPVGKRHVHCPTCGAHWSTQRIDCIRCGDQEPKNHIYLQSDQYPGVEIVFCHSCGEYFKEFDLRERDIQDFLWEDIRTLPLNFAVENKLSTSDHLK